MVDVAVIAGGGCSVLSLSLSLFLSRLPKTKLEAKRQPPLEETIFKQPLIAGEACNGVLYSALSTILS